MPMHDWSRVESGLYHHFHQYWAVAICDVLNGGLLPSGFSALIERHSDNQEPEPFQPRIESFAARGNRIAIRHRMMKLVCVIELVSPGNKHSRSSIRQFVDKAVGFLRSGVHLLILDPFPPSPRDPQGIHKAIFDEIEKIDFRLPADQPLTLAAYEADIEGFGLNVTAYVEPIGVGTTLPDMPAYLDLDEYVAVPLESTYQLAWANCPPDMRVLVETGKLREE